ncbi:hypothetical protein [Neorhizobium sp. DAR64862/K0K3]|uniref:hypothetical protein n=1 Tax=Neorhizobium sp. DAR64862/K0K3 TaxID=3421957 RepID=UPI003D2D7823
MARRTMRRSMLWRRWRTITSFFRPTLCSTSAMHCLLSLSTGPGKLVIDGFEIGGSQLEYEADRANVFFQPEIYFDGGKDGRGGITPPNIPGIQRYDNIFLAPGSKRVDTALNRAWRSTVVGVGAAANFEELERCDIIGNSAMRYARFGNRVTAVGTLNMQWLGQTITQEAHPDYWFHDMFWPKHPSDPTWDVVSLETRNPGMRAKIAAYSDWATNSDQVTGNVGIGRDSILELVKGVYNTGTGYQSLWLLLNGDANAAFAYKALQSLVFGSSNAAFGDQAGRYFQEGSFNGFFGSGAGLDLIKGDLNLFMGFHAGAGVSIANRSIFIGNDAGRDLAGLGDDIFVLANIRGATRRPLVTGNFASGRFGINTLLTDLSAGLFQVRKQINGDLGFLVDDDVRVLLGATSALTANTVNARLQIAGSGLADASQHLSRYSANNGSPFLLFNKSRGATIGANAIVQNGDVLGTLQFQGANGSNFDAAAALRVLVDGVPGPSGDMPGRWEFQTSADGTSVPVTRLTIKSSGRINIATLVNAANDSAAATAGVEVGDLYRNGSVVQYRVS